ncbi:formate dehydrogenase, alpha subunit [Desulfovibrio sp. 3_1_syn3]|nr:formate dehydrogenase, alpha subunit [Desulfovibrio sp. 3_1_syn3]
MTNHWIDIKNADAVLIIGSNAAEHHPVAFKWIMRAKDKGAVLMHVDPKFSRTSARCDFHVPLRSGTDIAFLGGMVNYIIQSESYLKDYVLNYTNASFVVGKDYAFEDGLFSGYDPKTRSYDRSKWAFEKGPDGAPVRDAALRNERCVFNLMKKHYARYTLKNVSDVTGVSEKNLMRVYEAFCATGKPDKAGTILYALGWTQHTVGVQNIRTSTLVQLLLGNIGVAGGGINALRGEPNVQGSTDHALLYNILPGYIALPLAQWQTLEEFNKANTPVTALKNSANWWGNRPKYFASLLKGWFGDEATPENDFCYGLLPKGEAGVDYSYMYVMDRMLHGEIKGGFIFGVNPMNSFPNTNKMRVALDNLDWLVCSELHHSETTDNWRRPGADPKEKKTEVFLLPSAHRVEKEGTISNSGRWLLWFDKAVEPGGEARNFADIFVPLVNRIRALYTAEGGTLPEPLLKLNWPETFDAEEWTRRINGLYWADAKVGNKIYKRGQLVPAFGQLKEDGSTSSLNWLYCGSYTEEEGNKSKRRDPSQTPMQAAIGLFPNWSWCWPVNRRILYNRASVDLNGQPLNPAKPVIKWDGKKWVGDVPDGPWPPQADAEKGKLAFIMTTDGYAQLYGTGRLDGPFPEHYEPAETPLARHPFSGQLRSPVYKFHSSELDKFAEAADPRYPIVLTTYSLTEHWCGGGETRNVPNLLETEPQLYIEMSHDLAKEKGIKNGDGVIIESARGRVEAIAMVTIRIRPFTVMGKTVHLVGMPFAFGWTTPKCGDSTNRLTVTAYDPNTTIPETKACCVNIRKADTLTEIA